MYDGESRDSLFTASVPFSSPLPLYHSPLIPSVFLIKDKHNQSQRGRKREYYIGWSCNFVSRGRWSGPRAPRAPLFSFHYTMLRRVIIVLIICSKGRGSPPPPSNPRNWPRIFYQAISIFPSGIKSPRTTAVSTTIVHPVVDQFSFRRNAIPAREGIAFRSSPRATYHNSKMSKLIVAVGGFSRNFRYA